VKIGLERREAGFIQGGAVRWSLILLLSGIGVSVLGAKDFTAYRVGDVVDEDIVTPVALNVIDPVATATLKSSESLKTPAIFLSCPGMTNVLAAQFEVAFENTRSNFISAIQGTFHETVLDHATVMSPDFGYLVTAFNIDNKKFPIPTFLAMDWAYGKDGSIEKDKWLGSLLDLMRNSIRPDDLPVDFNLGETLRLVPVGDPDEKLTLSDMETRDRLVLGSSLVPLSQVRTQFRREFTSYDEQLLARALAAWLQPDCFPAVALTQSARAAAVRQLIVAEYYAAGQVIAPKGSVVDQKIKAALDELQVRPAVITTAIAAMPAAELPEPQVAMAVDHPAPKDQIQTPAPSQPVAMPNPLEKSSSRNSSNGNWLMAGAAFAAVIVLITVWRFIPKRSRGSSALSVVADTEFKNTPLLQTELAPQLVQIVRQAFVQELAGQRRDLLLAQQAAAAEVIRLVHRMDELQVAMQERLRAYESQIQTLEGELTARTEENRQLIRLKIQMIRHQVDAESGVKRVEFN
jgi:7TM-HD extracellular